MNRLVGFERFHFDFSWFCVLWIGMLLFAHNTAMREAFVGKTVLILYLTYCLYHSLQMFNRLLYSIMARSGTSWNGKRLLTAVVHKENVKRTSDSRFKLVSK